MAASRTTTEEVEKIVEIAILKLDLKYTGQLNDLRKEWRDSRRWNFSAIFTVVMALIALGSAIAANLP